jgi:hypothetical protein
MKDLVEGVGFSLIDSQYGPEGLALWLLHAGSSPCDTLGSITSE